MTFTDAVKLWLARGAAEVLVWLGVVAAFVLFLLACWAFDWLQDRRRRRS